MRDLKDIRESVEKNWKKLGTRNPTMEEYAELLFPNTE